MKIKIDNMIIEPQAGDYEFLSMEPRRIGDQALIAPDAWAGTRGPFIPCVQVILLADKSGRKWLVETK